MEAGTSHACAITRGSKAYCWGYGKRGQIGDGKTAIRFTPRRPGRRPRFDHAAYRARNVIERAVGWLKERRRIATRYEKPAVQYLAMLYVSAYSRST